MRLNMTLPMSPWFFVFFRQNDYKQLIMNAGMMETDTFSERWCRLVGHLNRWNLRNFVEPESPDMIPSFMPMCKCITATVKDLGMNKYIYLIKLK